MDRIINLLIKAGIPKKDLDYHVVQDVARASHATKYVNVDFIDDRTSNDVLACHLPESAGTASR